MKKNVLIIDDDPDLLEMTSLVLKKDGYQVHTLEDSTNIVAEVKNIKPDLILMDLWMPNVEGNEAIELLRKDEATANIPVVLFSAYPKLPQIADELNVNYLSKPFALKELREKLNSV